ncbi:PP2C family protein-serine/threonine phosphatase [Nonomuraea fuscirosea]|uniref:PP2C family protein-serine/threonine phosphatase n=1 Tax=Nonomuraea fuscirosea TaxID=1291556 RepID=UPI0033C2BC2B
MLTIDATGVVAQANEAARLVLAGTADGDRSPRTAPGWLTRAHDGHGAVEGEIGGRTFQAHPVHSGGGRTVWWLVDVTEQRAEAAARQAEHERAVSATETGTRRGEREWAACMVEAANELLPSLNLDRCLDSVARLAVRYLADVALVVLPVSGRKQLLTWYEPDRGVLRESVSVDPRTMPGLAEALQSLPPASVHWIDPAELPAWLLPHRPDEHQPDERRPDERRPDEHRPDGVTSVAVTTLPGHGLPVGALVLLRHGRPAAFEAGEQVFLRLFTALAGSAISAARLYTEQVTITEVLMAELLPPPTPRLQGVELAALYRPAGPAERVGGDFYDVHAVAGTGGESLVVLGDVAGKGLEAAVLTGRIRNTLRALLPLADDHRCVLERLNSVLVNDGDPTRYVTLVLVSFERHGRRVSLRVTSAGHPPPLIIRNDGRVETVPAEGTLIGAIEEVSSVTTPVVLEPGETCLLYSDGIIEARGGPLGQEFFGEERLCEQLLMCAGMPPEALAERVQMLASQWVRGGEHDDMAVVAITAPRDSPPNGPAQDTSAQGASSQGTPAHGVPAQGVPAQGVPAQGVPAQGTPTQGTPTQGTPTGGTR